PPPGRPVPVRAWHSLAFRPPDLRSCLSSAPKVGVGEYEKSRGGPTPSPGWVGVLAGPRGRFRLSCNTACLGATHTIECCAMSNTASSSPDAAAGGQVDGCTPTAIPRQLQLMLDRVLRLSQPKLVVRIAQ